MGGTILFNFERILGIDPSLRNTGYAFIRLNGNQISIIEIGSIKCARSWHRTRCLAEISMQIRKLIQLHRPQVCVVESLFHAYNHKTALILGEARGASLSVVAESQIPIFEIAPRKVKQAIAGYGGASKEAIAHLLKNFLGIERFSNLDASDALAIVIAFVSELKHLLPALPPQIKPV